MGEAGTDVPQPCPSSLTAKVDSLNQFGSRIFPHELPSQVPGILTEVGNVWLRRRVSWNVLSTIADTVLAIIKCVKPLDESQVGGFSPSPNRETVI